MELTLEVVEGPDAGKTASLAGAIVIGRDPAADLVLHDDQVSRRHARITARPDGAVVEDLGSSNGTFVNHDQVHGATSVTAGDELLIGISIVQVRSAAQVASQGSAVRAIPPALAIAERRPTFLDPAEDRARPAPVVVPELDRLVDARTKTQAKLAPFAMLVLVLLVVAVFFGTQPS